MVYVVVVVLSRYIMASLVCLAGCIFVSFPDDVIVVGFGDGGGKGLYSFGGGARTYSQSSWCGYRGEYAGACGSYSYIESSDQR